MAKADATPALVEAYAGLTADGVAITVRALRERARVSTEAARLFLAANRPSREVTAAPNRLFDDLNATLWAAAVAAARDEDAEVRDAERAALVAAEADAHNRVDAVVVDRNAQGARADQAEADIAALRTQLDDLRDRLAAAEKARDTAVARTEAAQADAEQARQARHAAELAAADAHATARTLRDIIDAQK